MKILSLILGAFWINFAMACPYCAGSNPDARDKYTVFILLIFIVACYVPLAMLFNLMRKNRALNNIEKNDN
ncbi:MAG: hypothetical protein HOE90_08300 [Bacteriovoracaceae bacterium]|jgi:hypothetical protein|nr:hypothetical protein [Bacteriovoracaceae bacterium]